MIVDLFVFFVVLVEMLDVIVCYVVEIQKSVCIVINDLCLMLLGEVSLIDLLVELVVGFCDVLFQICIIFDIDFVVEGYSFGELVELLIYCFVCESVLNVMCYGQVMLICVSFELQLDDFVQFVVCVIDNGCGLQCSVDGVCLVVSFGQIGMQDCVCVLGVIYLLLWCDYILIYIELRMFWL